MAAERMRTIQNNIFIQHELKHFCSNDTRTDIDTSDNNIAVKAGRHFVNMGWVSKAWHTGNHANVCRMKDDKRVCVGW